ncbi:replicative DNA helicase [uncultured Alistipes sp.]|uniref:replicative DNA helicase n=1 Tax=uncultured Alistipes sp. TaxID=538949 RepID=UPI00262B190C|nr:replicative DNA helicase [uncultured Alistipes sp.]
MNRNNQKRNDGASAATPDYLPSDSSLEAAVLGALLLENQYLADIRGIITSTAFYDAVNATLFGILCRLDDKGATPDLYTVSQQAKAERIAPAYVAGLTQAVGSGVEVLNHARQLADLEMRRRLILFSAELAAKAQAGPDAAEWAAKQLDEITGAALYVDTARPIGEVLSETLRDLERRQQAHEQGACVGIPTGLPYLDRITGGWRGGQLIILAARPAMGKTALALHFAQAAASTDTPVCIFSLEMPDTQLAGRMLVGTSGTDATAFRAGNVTAEDWRRIEHGAAGLGRLPIHLIDTASISMPRIRALCRAMQRRGRCGMVVIDYLQLIAVPTEEKRYGNREREVAEISRAAKLLAKELDVPVILLAQLSRKVEERTDKTPLLSDLRESGAIEQDADMVLFIDRPAVYGIQEFDTGRYGVVSSQGVGRLTIAKNREGGTGFIPFRHNESLTQITDYDTIPTAQGDEDDAF